MSGTIDELIQKAQERVRAGNFRERNLEKDKEEIVKAMQDRDKFRKTIAVAMPLFQPHIQKALNTNSCESLLKKK